MQNIMKFSYKNIFVFLKKFFLSIFVIVLLTYIAIYLLLPFLLNRNDYSQKITETVKNQTGLVLIIKNYKINVSPKLEITIKADEINLFYPDKKQILSINKGEFNVSSLYLLKKEIKINKIKADKFQFSTKLLKNNQTSIQAYIEKNIKNKDKTFTLSKNTPKIDIANYIIKIKDEESGQKFKIKGKDFKLIQNLDYRYLSLSSNGEFYCFDKKYVTYTLKLAIPKSIFDEVNTKLFDIPFNNFYKQNFYADLKSDLKIHTKNNQFDYVSGETNIDNFSIELGNTKLPPSYFHIKTDKGFAFITSKFYTNIDELTNIKAIIKVKKPYEIEMECNCPKADITNLQKLSSSVLDLLKIKNNIIEFNAKGSISADFSIKSDFKKLKSNGSLKIENAQISHKKVPLVFSDINALIDFSNNSIKIKQSNLLINSQPVKITGTVCPDATGDIEISANNLDLKNIIKAFPTIGLPKNIAIMSGKLSFLGKIKGKLANASPQINSNISNFAAIDINSKTKIAINNIILNTTIEKQKLKGNIKLKKTSFILQNISNIYSTLTSENTSIDFDNKNIKILPAKFTTGKANMTLHGDIKNYNTTPEATINASGTINTDFLKSIINQYSNRTIVYNKGYIPFQTEIKSKQNQTFIDAKFLANNNNYITPVFVNSYSSTNTLTHSIIRIDKNNIDSLDISLYYAPNLNNLKNNVNTFKLKKSIAFKGKINNYLKSPNFENIKLQTLNPLNITIPQINDSKADINTDLTINGNIEKPIITGIINATNIDIPLYFIKIQNAIINMSQNSITTQINSIKLRNTLVNAEVNIPQDFLKTNRINNLKIDIGYADMEYLMPLLQILGQSKYAPGVDFPYTIISGKINIKTFKNGVLKAENVTSDLCSKPNILYFKNLYANAYGGKAAGKVTYNIPYSSIHAQIQGRGMNAEAAAKDFMPQEQQISGRLNFDADIIMFGNTPEQQTKTLKGRADVLIQQGHLGQLGRFEHFLYAQNLLSQRLIYASLNSAKQAISPKDTGRFTYLKGMLKFNNGYVYLNPLITSGPQMSMYITGNLNPLTSEADLQILGKVSSEVSSSLGLLGSMTIKDFLDEHTKYGQTIASLFNFCNSELPEIDISKIPELTPNLRYQTKNFRVLIIGDAKSVKSVKSFTWVNPIGTKQKALTEKAKEAIEKVLPQNKNNVQKTTSQEINNKQQKIIIESRPMQQNKPAGLEPASFLDNIPDNFKD